MPMKWIYLFFCSLLLAFTNCGTSKNVEGNTPSTKESLNDKNRSSISLLDQIRRLPGVGLQNGLPVFTKTASTITQGSTSQPLYILDNYIVGNSFRDVNELVRNVEVEKIEALTGSDASFYGSRAAHGVIKITTIK